MSQTSEKPKLIRGRGASQNPSNRFETLEIELDEESGQDKPSLRTQFFVDHSKSILVSHDSPDLGFGYSVNPYRGCEHGCIYCYARPTHEYLGFSAGLDFETKIMVKTKAPELLRKELSSAKWRPQTVSLSGVTDCYQPVERQLELTRRCLEVFAEFRNPVAIITKNQLVTRDLDILRELANYQAVAVFVTVTTLKKEITQILEPRTSSPAGRLETIETLSRAGIPVGVMVAPVIPALTDSEIPAILQAAARAGARCAAYVMLRLPYGLGELFQNWLSEHFPERKEKILNRLRDLRGGKLYKSDFGSRMRGEGVFAKQVGDVFKISRKKAGLNQTMELSTENFRRAEGAQLKLF